MRSLTILFMIVLTASAMADSPQAIEWVKLRALTAGETQEEKTAHLRAHGLDKSSSIAVLDYVDHGEDAIREEGRKDLVRRCKNRAVLENDAEAFAKDVEESIAREQAIYNGLIDNIPVLLSKRAADGVKAALAHGGEVSVFETKVAEHIRAGDIDLKATFNRMCGDDK